MWPQERKTAMPDDALSKDEKEAVRFISKGARTALVGIGIPGVFGTGTILSLKDTHVRDTFTLWVFWLSAGVLVVSALSGLFCGAAGWFQNPRRATQAFAVTSIIAFILGMVGDAILCTLTNLR